MLTWTTIAYGAILSALLAGIAVVLAARELRVRAALGAAAGAFTGPFAWNAILHATSAHQFFVDAPVRVIPASWQDTGSGVFSIAATALLLGLGPLGSRPARPTMALALLAGVAAFLVDVYLY
ncbi:hypothetical protein ACWEV3_30075 [Saccharopolyspora sp. NPDC003752]